MENNFEHISEKSSLAEFIFSEQTLSIFDNVFAFYGTVNAQGIILQLKGKFLEQTSLDTELLTGQRFSETVFWQSSEYTAQILEKAIEETAKGTSSKVFLDFRLSSEETRFIELHLQVSDKFQSEEIFFCAYDVTAYEKQVEYYKQRSEQLLYAAESAEIGLWSWDLNTGLVYSTPHCNKIFDTPPFELLTYDSIVKILHPEDLLRVEKVLDHSQKTGSEYNEQFRIIYADGKMEWISARGKTLPDTNGNPEKMMGVVRKITEQKRAEAEIAQIYEREKQARDEAVEANRAKDFFLVFVSHELRSPLNAILGWSKILLSKNVDAATQKSALETIERSARSQARLINDLVDSARITSGKLRLEFHPVNLFDIIKTVFLSQKPDAEGKNISFEFNANTREIPIIGDANRLQQVFNNLISNALKFTPKDGMILISVEAGDENVTISVKDSGAGINPEILPNIFRQFTQGDEKSSSNSGGLGLGLSIVKILVEKHNGTVIAGNDGIGQGANFTVTLPLTKVNANNAEKAEKSGKAEDKPLSGVKILLVEDDYDSREVLTLFLNQCGAVVESAESAKTAMQILQNSEKNLPNVIISDLAMPEEDGYSLISRIRKLPTQTGSQVPAIALSAFATEENKQKAFQSGFQRYSTKPFEPDLLIKEILSLVKN